MADTSQDSNDENLQHQEEHSDQVFALEQAGLQGYKRAFGLHSAIELLQRARQVSNSEWPTTGELSCAASELAEEKVVRMLKRYDEVAACEIRSEPIPLTERNIKGGDEA